jgi:hypothetical protein
MEFKLLSTARASRGQKEITSAAGNRLRFKKASERLGVVPVVRFRDGGFRQAMLLFGNG